MGVRHDYRIRPPHHVFTFIDMKGGDKTQCWPWKGTFGPNPIFYWHKTRWQARRMVYALRHGLHYDLTGQITSTCGDSTCCNPDHLVQRWSLGHQIRGKVKQDSCSSSC